MSDYSVKEILSQTDERIAAGAMGDYSLTEKDMRVALALFRQFRPETVLDFGVNEGHTADFLLKHCPWIKLWVGVDLLPEKFPERGIVPKVAGRLATGDPRFCSLLTDETIGDFQVKVAKLIAGQPGRPAAAGFFDCVIIDANHEDWATKRDTEGTAPYLRKGGLWLWHDYNVESRQNPNARVFGVKGYLDGLIAAGRQIKTPDEADRDPWTCCSLAWEMNI